ncbi:cytochrome c oxidase assembly protein COX11, mitochondrial isoform X2 [Syngnathoides biaculeatus]|uniref:cytochrome c oxidase assembly protein COX11, mitochondrial isoform X2 n=1 Tax=Syngnathoides biaculeatus TaxID=300417 RepID=UPI002ADD497E|nr:cytochrome c oxidase assembly protein COX11, mitochondrial isoform X2 [Syngnathoides biaculeatus]
MTPPVVRRSLGGLSLSAFLRALRWRAGRPPLFLWRPHVQIRGLKTQRRPGHEEQRRSRNKTALTYVAAAGVAMVGLSYAAVPLYRLYCQAAGLGGTAVSGHDSELVQSMDPVRERVVKVTFNADTHASMQWNFRPQQTEIFVVPGETALAFYRAKNPTDKAVVGISTYNVVPFEAGQYFNKIQAGEKKMLLLRGAAPEPPRGGGHARLLLHRPRVRRGPQDGSRGHHHAVLHLLRGQGRPASASAGPALSPKPSFSVPWKAGAQVRNISLIWRRVACS